MYASVWQLWFAPCGGAGGIRKGAAPRAGPEASCCICRPSCRRGARAVRRATAEVSKACGRGSSPMWAVSGAVSRAASLVPDGAEQR